MTPPPPPPPPAPGDDSDLSLYPIVISHVNTGVEFIDDLANDDERDEMVEQMNLHGNAIQCLDGLEMLPRLKLLDEEEVEFLKEMGSLHMPKYRSLVRRIVENKGSGRQPRSPQDAKGRHHHQRLILKDTSTNTSVDLEKDVLKREQSIARRETEFLEKEKLFLTKENEFFGRENDLKAQINELKEKLEAAEDRAAKAEATVLEMSSHLLQKEKNESAVPDEPAHSTQKSQAEQEAVWNATIESLKASNQLEIEQLNAANAELEKKLAMLETENTTLTQKLHEAEEQVQVNSSALEKSENQVNIVAREMELAQKTHEAVVTQLSNEVKYHKDRAEQADKLNSQHEKQVTELKANIEAVYNRFEKSLAARQDEFEMLRIQHAKDSERQEKLLQQQQDLYERQLQASIIQVEMEFCKEYQQSAQKFQSFRRKTDERLKEIKRVREAYQVSLQREAATKAEVEKLQAILADDKKKLFVEDAKRSDTFKAHIREEKSKRKQLEQRLMAEQEKYAQMALLSADLDEKKLEIGKLHEEIQNLEEQRASWKKLEDDLRAALKVKDVMLADQQRQIKELTDERQNSEAHFNDELAEFQAQIEDLEAALDESLQKAAEEEVKSEKLSAKLAAVEKEVPKKDEEVTSLRSQLEQKVSALEFLDQEMQRMRTVLDNQDGLFQKRMQKHLEQQREEVERVRAAAEEERDHQLHRWEAERGKMIHKYELLASEMENVAAQNAKLREVLDQERCKTAQNDRDMRVLLAQIDRERQIKKQNLRQIKSLFEQLQREAL
eukprot:jgi/Phyca11/530140/estExt2_fgenesh1_pm.C_PHYCAscaffold_550065